MTDAALPVARDLHLDVTRARKQLLDIDFAVAERLLRFVLAKLIGALELGLVEHRPHAAPAAARDRLDHDAVGRLVEERPRLFEAGRLRGTLQYRHLALLGQGARCRLVAEQVERLRRGPDKDQASRFTSPGELGVFAQEAVAGMDRIAPALFRSCDNLRDIEVGGRADALQRPALIAATRVQRVRIVLGEHANRGNSHVSCSARDPDRDFTAIGDQQSFHRTNSFALAHVGCRKTSAHFSGTCA